MNTGRQNLGFTTKRDESNDRFRTVICEASAGRKTFRGFTLIETIIVISATTIILLALTSMLTYFYKTNAYTFEQSTAVEQARRGIEAAMKDLREASYGSDGSYPISSVGTSSLTFYANINSDVNIERVTYTLSNGVFSRTTVQPAGNPPVYTGQPGTTTTIISSVVSDATTPVFRYYDKTGAELTGSINVSLVASVTTSLVIDVNVNRAPVAFTLTGGATLRNLKEQK